MRKLQTFSYNFRGGIMITTKDVKIKDYGNVKLPKMITTNKVQPEEFKMKGKGAPKPDITINTANIEEYQKKRKVEVKEENRKAKIRQKKLDEEIRVQREKEKKEKPEDTGLYASLRR